MSIQVYGCNLVAIEVGDVDKAVAFSQDVFGVEKLEMTPLIWLLPYSEVQKAGVFRVIS